MLFRRNGSYITRIYLRQQISFLCYITGRYVPFPVNGSHITCNKNKIVAEKYEGTCR